MIDTVILDVDGTLVDSNYHHTLAWSRAFGRHDLDPPLWRIHRAIGMGGDKLVAEVAGHDVENALGDALREQWTEEFDQLIGEVRPFDGSRHLLETLKQRDLRVVCASSGQPQHVEAFLDLFGGRSVADAWTTAEDAEESKPAADLLLAALARVHGSSGVMVGDATWDARAARAAAMPSIGLRTGGFGDAELRDAGALEVLDGPQALADAVEQGLLNRL
jgi:phosphoglycolate phosphatase-like HAD superfamily hydrolase